MNVDPTGKYAVGYGLGLAYSLNGGGCYQDAHNQIFEGAESFVCNVVGDYGLQIGTAATASGFVVNERIPERFTNVTMTSAARSRLSGWIRGTGLSVRGAGIYCNFRNGNHFRATRLSLYFAVAYSGNPGVAWALTVADAAISRFLSTVFDPLPTFESDVEYYRSINESVRRQCPGGQRYGDVYYAYEGLANSFPEIVGDDEGYIGRLLGETNNISAATDARLFESEIESLLNSEAARSGNIASLSGSIGYLEQYIPSPAALNMPGIDPATINLAMMYEITQRNNLIGSGEGLAAYPTQDMYLMTALVDRLARNGHSNGVQVINELQQSSTYSVPSCL